MNGIPLMTFTYIDDIPECVFRIDDIYMVYTLSVSPGSVQHPMHDAIVLTILFV